MWFYNTHEDCKPDLVSVSTPLHREEGVWYRTQH